MKQYQNYQTILEVSDMDELKEKSGKKQTQGALQAAVAHYLKCPGEVQ